MVRKRWGSAAAVLLLLAGGTGRHAAAREISGSREFSGEVVVAKGETWKLLPGASLSFRGGKLLVRGRLLAKGTPERPVRIAGDDAFEGLDFRGEDGSSLEHAVVSGGRRGAQATNARVAFRNVRWERNGIGLDVTQYARVTVDDCVFLSPRQVGILVRRGGAARVAGTAFVGAGRAGLYVYGAKDVTVRKSRFEGNATGLKVSLFGAAVSIAESVFRGNGTGLLAEKMAVPDVEDCEFSGNGTGLAFSRRADGRVSGSRIEGNGDGVLVEYSSYPVFRGNRFGGNREFAVRLRNQSSQWEEEVGDREREEAEGAGGAPFGGSPTGRADFAPGGAAVPGRPPAARKEPRDGTVDFRGNDWGGSGEDAEKEAGADGIHDGRDEESFEYKGKRYRMDRVLTR